MLKGTAAVYISGRLFGPDLQIVAACVAVVGHVFPVWLRFKGGKGVATYLGVTLALSPLAGAAFAGIWLITALISRYSSLSALVASAATPFVLGYVLNVRVGIVFLILTGLLFWKHSANIKRLMSGTESRIGSGDGKEPKESKRTRRS
jgi:glycerol-3-phosphate acyltransferase PlsY